VDSAGEVAVVALFAIGPVVLVMLTSFVKLSVVLAVLRNGLGAPDVPSGIVVTGLALVLTLFIMAPVIDDVVDAMAPAKAVPAQAPPADGGAAAWVNRDWPEGPTGWLAAGERAAAPVKAFLAEHAHRRDRETFVGLASRLGGGRAVADDELRVLAPAFVTSELAEAFAIGFLLLLPFLVIDLVVGMSLAALGLNATSPQVVSLPLKLLLFVAVDGWRLLVEGLVLGYA
jgi:type III secretion protein R